MPIGKTKKKNRSSGRIAEQAEFQVFVGHASSDKWIAKTICEKIESVGATTFRDDRDIAGGDDIPDAIRQELKRSQELLIVLSPDSVDRPWVLFEAGAFWGRRKVTRIIAVLCHVEVDTIPGMIKSKKAISINDLDSYLKELKTRMRKR